MNVAMSQGTLNGVRALLVAMTALVGSAVGVSAQQSEQSEPASASLKRIRDALQSPQHLISSDGNSLVAPSKPDDFRLGVLTFEPPDTPGQALSIRVPIGALASRAVHSVAVAHHRHAENAARDEVAKALAEFQRAQPK